MYCKFLLHTSKLVSNKWSCFTDQHLFPSHILLVLSWHTRSRIYSHVNTLYLEASSRLPRLQWPQMSQSLDDFEEGTFLLLLFLRGGHSGIEVISKYLQKYYVLQNSKFFVSISPYLEWPLSHVRRANDRLVFYVWPEPTGEEET